MKQVFFEKYMTVFHFKYGKGIVEDITPDNEQGYGPYCVQVRFQEFVKGFTYDGRECKSEPISLSQNPIPIPEIKNTPIVKFEKGELVWVQFSSSSSWEARFYSDFSHGKHRVFINQYKQGTTASLDKVVKFDTMPMLK